jgi:hypothetical protein
VTERQEISCLTVEAFVRPAFLLPCASPQSFQSCLEQLWSYISIPSSLVRPFQSCLYHLLIPLSHRGEILHTTRPSPEGSLPGLSALRDPRPCFQPPHVQRGAHWCPCPTSRTLVGRAVGRRSRRSRVAARGCVTERPTVTRQDARRKVLRAGMLAALTYSPMYHIIY